jgi:hypothetical protein
MLRQWSGKPKRIGGRSGVAERNTTEVLYAYPRRPEGAYANAALFIALVRKLIDKGVISKEEMSGIVDDAGSLLSQGNPIAMRQALQTLRWFRQNIGIEGAATEG